MARGDAAFSPEVKELIHRRASGRCDRCGLPAERAHFHHRTPRRAGGSSLKHLGLPSNGLLLHPSCHDYIESHRTIASQLGFIVGYGSFPHHVPVMLWRGWALLNHDGTAVMLPSPPPPLVAVDADALSDVDDVADVDSGVAAEPGSTS